MYEKELVFCLQVSMGVITINKYIGRAWPLAYRNLKYDGGFDFKGHLKSTTWK